MDQGLPDPTARAAAAPTGIDIAIAAAIDGLDDASAARLAKEMLESGFGLVADRPDPLDLKIAAAALAEMREAFAMFAPYRDIPKVTVFGSARTLTNDPLYAQATEIAKLLAERGWMVVTGAGPGIMQAAMEGAGRERSIGVSIRLPFEQGANP
ncbi:MAG: Rossman fold protein, TIGR00730 family, partial [Actinomycetota bacterium]|nr:Rossman fold protein, TIGR00730 family [Actinomycetota bacterium]